ncbi:hypothetical protein R20233_01279 [Ralstonia sp. LMG 32965]|nr:hypothetical protein R20233_01279 [Ralstonia sp. LMG 32965]
MPRPAPLLTIGKPDPASRVLYTGWPVFALGFRPFHLLATAFAVVGMALWAALLLGVLPSAQSPATMAPLFWHAHEMVFGFAVAVAVVVGFLFTAGKNWTGLQTPQGPQLAALAALWLAARVLMWTGPALLPREVWIGGASVLWVVAFVAYLWRYTPWLMAPRADGREG